MNSYHHFLVLFAISFLSWSVLVHSQTSTSTMRARYQQWMAEHNKIYLDNYEFQQRFQIFQENVKFIDAFNAAGNNSYTLGLNQFSDLTNEERLERFTGYRPPSPSVWNTSTYYERERTNLERLSTYWDWRKKGAVTPVKSQTCGNCWLFAGMAAVESVNFIATGNLYTLSEQEVMDCDNLPGKGGCNGGWPQEVYEYVKHYGVTLEQDYPNRPQAETCDNNKKSKHRYARVSGSVIMPNYVSDEELMRAVTKNPVSVAFDASNPNFGSYKGGVYTGPCGSNVNHAMSIVGFGEGDGLKYWIVRNSWGAGWGEGGYIRIQRGTGRGEGLCGINMWANYPIY